ncbi:TrbC/VirB2 family protein [Methylobacterium radiotolerans]|uniref:TrbC/VirB2 family protein n=1 Tax=Methylobacterium radiotolerans TaxID=31998 RepID=UPI00158EA71D|nr:TrbC/VirB2 family protein [Methylobacterium radiotolerans]
MERAKRVIASALALPARVSIAYHSAPDRLNAGPDKLQARIVAGLTVLAAMLCVATPAEAQAGGGGQITSFLQNLVNLITGTAGKLISILAIAVTGICKMLGIASMRTLVTVIFGVMLVFGASWIVDQIVGG